MSFTGNSPGYGTTPWWFRNEADHESWDLFGETRVSLLEARLPTGAYMVLPVG